MIEIDWVEIPAGKTTIGVPMTNTQARSLPADYPEYPEESIDLPGFRISRFPITVGEFQRYLQEHLRTKRLLDPQFDQFDRVPVVGVTWREALEYCDWVTNQVGYQVRLPTAAEWQKAARGPDGFIYPYGNVFDPTKCNVRESGYGKLTPVDHFPEGASPYGVFDMSGNCWEWTMTVWRNRELKIDEERLPTYAEYEDNSIKEGVKTICGGAYTTTERMSRATTQYLRASYYTINLQGFRLACKVE